MNLSALERLDLNDRLDELMVQATTAKGNQSQPPQLKIIRRLSLKTFSPGSL